MDENEIEIEQTETVDEPSGEFDDLRAELEKLYDENSDDDGNESESESESDTSSEDPADEGNEEKVDEESNNQDAQPDIPDDVKSYINELEIEKSISQQFKQALEPHFEFIQEFGINPYHHVNDLLTVSKTLTKGSPEDKAGMIASLCDMFKIDISMLDDALYEIQNRPAPSKEDEILNKLNNLEQRISTQAVKNDDSVNTSELEREISEFASKHEFFNDVKEDMGVFLNSGKAKSLKEAYELALKINDNVQNKIRQRTEKTAIAAKAGKASLKGSKAPTKVKSGGNDLRSALEDFWDANE